MFWNIANWQRSGTLQTKSLTALTNFSVQHVVAHNVDSWNTRNRTFMQTAECTDLMQKVSADRWKTCYGTFMWKRLEELRPKINHTQTQAVPHTSCHHCTVQSVCQVSVALWGRAELQQVRSFLVQGHTCQPQPHHHQYVLLQHSCTRPAHCMSGNMLGPVWRAK